MRYCVGLSSGAGRELRSSLISVISPAAMHALANRACILGILAMKSSMVFSLHSSYLLPLLLSIWIKFQLTLPIAAASHRVLFD